MAGLDSLVLDDRTFLHVRQVNDDTVFTLERKSDERHRAFSLVFCLTAEAEAADRMIRAVSYLQTRLLNELHADELCLLHIPHYAPGVKPVRHGRTLRFKTPRGLWVTLPDSVNYDVRFVTETGFGIMLSRREVERFGLQDYETTEEL